MWFPVLAGGGRRRIASRPPVNSDSNRRQAQLDKFDGDRVTTICALSHFLQQIAACFARKMLYTGGLDHLPSNCIATRLVAGSHHEWRNRCAHRGRLWRRASSVAPCVVDDGGAGIAWPRPPGDGRRPPGTGVTASGARGVTATSSGSRRTGTTCTMSPATSATRTTSIRRSPDCSPESRQRSSAFVTSRSPASCGSSATPTTCSSSIGPSGPQRWLFPTSPGKRAMSSIGCPVCRRLAPTGRRGPHLASRRWWATSRPLSIVPTARDRLARTAPAKPRSTRIRRRGFVQDAADDARDRRSTCRAAPRSTARAAVMPAGSHAPPHQRSDQHLRWPGQWPPAYTQRGFDVILQGKGYQSKQSFVFGASASVYLNLLSMEAWPSRIHSDRVLAGALTAPSRLSGARAVIVDAGLQSWRLRCGLNTSPAASR